MVQSKRVKGAESAPTARRWGRGAADHHICATGRQAMEQRVIGRADRPAEVCLPMPPSPSPLPRNQALSRFRFRSRRGHSDFVMNDGLGNSPTPASISFGRIRRINPDVQWGSRPS